MRELALNYPLLRPNAMDSSSNIGAPCHTNGSPAQLETSRERLPWYAIGVRCNAEKNVSIALQNKGYEQYLPLYQHQNRWSDRVKKLELPLFRGYVFCRMDVALRRPVLTTPGVVNVIGFGSQFVSVPDSQIQAVQDVIESGLPSVPWPFLQKGQRIRVRTGALDGLEGLLVQVKNAYRVVVSVPLLQRSVAVEIDRNWIEPLPT